MKFAIRRFVCALTVFSVSFSGWAIAKEDLDPYSCVDPEFREAFGTYVYQATAPIYRLDLPDIFSNLDLPKTLTLVGSQSSSHLWNQQSRVVFKVEGDKAVGLATGIKILEKSGWRVKPIRSFFGGGFASEFRQNIVTACQEGGAEVLTVSTRNSKIGSLLELSVNSGHQANSCAELQSSALDPIDFRLLERFLPDLNLPLDATGRRFGSGGDDKEYGSHAMVEYGAGREALVSFLGEQIRNQGWKSEGQWAVSSSSGTIWSMSVEDPGELFGQLVAIESSPGTFNVRFSVIVARRI